MADRTGTETSNATPTPPPRPFVAVFRNANLRRLQLAFVGSAIGDWAYGTAVAVWAYGEGGARSVGIWMAIRFALGAVSSPFLAGLADRFPRKRVMILTDLVRAVLVTLAAVCLWADTPAWPIYVLATLASLLGTPFRVAQRAMMPSLADRPEELTAANGTSSTIESLSFFVGPALAALLLGVTSIPVVFMINVATFGWSMLLVARLTPRPALPRPAGDDDPAESYLRETAAGFRTIAASRGLRLVTLATAVQTFIAGGSAVFVLVMADEILGTGPRGVGFLDSVLGIGAIAGGVLAISRASRGRMGNDLALGVLLWSLPLALVAVWPTPVACFAAMALLGLGNPLVDVNFDTIVQRVAPEAVMGRVFGAVESCFIATMALGSLFMPFAIEHLGLRTALVALAAPVVLAALLLVAPLRRLDGELVQPVHLALFSSVDIFAPLAPAAVETLARSASAVRVAAGDVIVREGDVSDLFYVVERGRVAVTAHGVLLRHEGPGDYFGEIGLLRDVPRTATVTAVEDTVLQSIEREEFLSVVAGHGDARSAAEVTISRRLGG